MTDTKHILIVDDDVEISSLIAEFLGNYSFKVSQASCGSEMFDVLSHNDIDLIILDIMLPGDDGISLCREIRKSSNIPIIMLTAIGEATDKIIGLEVGADDYLSKPFNSRELLARIKAIFRRTETKSQHVDDNYKQDNQYVVSFDGWQLDIGKRILLSPERLEITITAGEFDLLIAFIENPQRVLSRDHLLDITKNRQSSPFDRSIDVQISRLRHKLETDPKNPIYIKTVRGGGYLFTPQLEFNNNIA